ncbi:MAG: type III-B CRISPR module-associated protein Cmr5 [Bacteroidia bacterium]
MHTDTDTRINRYLEQAMIRLEKLQENEQTPFGKKKDKAADAMIEKEYTGYTASLGATIVQCGLLPAIYLYSQTDGQGKDKTSLLDIIFELIKKDAANDDKECKSLLGYVRKYGSKLSTERHITDAIIALKLAMRTFPIDKNSQPS